MRMPMKPYDHRSALAVRSVPSQNRVSLQTVFDIVMPIVLFGALFAVYLQAKDVTVYSTPLPELLLLIGVFSIFGIVFAMRSGATLSMVTFYFCYVFFSAAPLQQFGLMWRDILFDDEASITAGVLCLMFTVAGIITCYLAKAAPPPKLVGAWGRSMLSRLKGVGEGRLLALMLLVAPMAIGLVGLYSSRLFTTRETFGKFTGALFPKELGIVVVSFIHPFVLIASAIGFYLALRNRSTLLKVGYGVLVCAALLIYNPLITPRFRLSAVLVFCALVAIGWNRTRTLFILLLVGTSLSPILNELRFDREMSDARSLSNFLVHMDYDAFTMVGYVIRYVWINGVDMGQSALSAFLFFVPRALWSGKTDHAAKIMFKFLNAEADVTIDNLSTPPVAEGYFAFGLLGALLGTLIYFFIVFQIERRARHAPAFSPATLIASLVPMYLFILLRGPLIVGVSELTGAVTALFAALWLLGVFASKAETQPVIRLHASHGLGRPRQGQI